MAYGGHRTSSSYARQLAVGPCSTDCHFGYNSRVRVGHEERA